MTRRANGVEGLRELKGADLGHSSWFEISQERIDLFAEATGDRQWIHVDPERAAATPFGGTIAHGYLTLSLVPVLLEELLEVDGVSAVLNYGIGKLRFPAPVPSGSRVRLGVVIDDVVDVAGGVQLTYAVTFEVEGQTKPACVAEVVYRVLS